MSYKNPLQFDYAKPEYTYPSQLRLYNQVTAFDGAKNVITISFSALHGPSNADELRKAIRRVQSILSKKFQVKGIRVLEFKIKRIITGERIYPHLHMVVDKAINHERLLGALVSAFPWFCDGDTVHFKPLQFTRIENIEKTATYLSKAETKAVPRKFAGITRVRATFGFPRNKRISSSKATRRPRRGYQSPFRNN